MQAFGAGGHEPQIGAERLLFGDKKNDSGAKTQKSLIGRGWKTKAAHRRGAGGGRASEFYGKNQGDCGTSALKVFIRRAF